ncbi:30S ribosomal protein S6 [Candidatus Microgenomates bacterium]|nr:MAG: 30S ribosomal protein S6 [Candidatus Microgenomates bacterium]
MNSYEVVIVLAGKTTPAKKKSVMGLVEKMITMFKGKLIESDEWGVKDLAYEIEDNSTGLFFVLTVGMPPSDMKAFQEKLRLENDIIRYLVVRK